jgi:ribonuclease HI
MFEFDFLAVVDGGSRDNGAANEGYGSYVLSTRDGRKETIRLDLGTATNNEAEYQTLIAALTDLSGRIHRAGKTPSAYSLLVHTDSQLMVNQLTQTWQIRAANLRPPVDEARSLKAAFGCCDLVKVPRDDVPTAGACVGALARSAARQTSATSPVPHGDRVLFFLGIELY